MSARGPRCPSELDLHRLIAGEGEAPALDARRAHLETCARCRARVDALAAHDVPAPSPAFWAEVAAAEARGRPRRLWSVLALAGALGATAVAWRLGRDREAPEVRTKGALALDVVVRRASGQIDRLAGGGGTLAAGETFRFELAHATGGHPYVVGLDARPSATLYVGAAGARAPLPGPGKTLLPEAIVADATPGAERVVALLCAEEIAPSEVEAAGRRALAAAGGRPANVGQLALPCAQASVLVQKSAPVR